MVREVLTLNVGQAGVQLGQNVWEQYCAEHKIDKIGRKQSKDNDKSFHCFYEETSDEYYIPRNLSIDLEPNVIDDVKQSEYSKIFNPQFLLSGKEDAANNFARGHYTVGAEMMDEVNNRIRKLVDSCDNLQGFVMNHSVGGGTGSGLGSLILEKLAVDYRKKSKFGFEIYPSPLISTSVVEAYNALLTTHWLLDHTEISCILDNEAIYEICQNKLDIKTPSYNNLNRLISKTISSITASLRFGGQLNNDLNEFQTNLVPFPRLHFMMTSMAPITTRKKMQTAPIDVRSITTTCFERDNFFTKISDFDVEEDKFMSISVNYRGDIIAKEANETINWLKVNKKVSFVEWCPTGFKVGITQQPPAVLQYDDIAPSKTNVVMIGNNTAISRIFSERISKKFDLMYSQRAFVHWFVNEGMEEGELVEAREDVGFLEKDYLDVLSEQATDEAYDDDDDDDDDDDGMIGLAIGGAKDVNNFRECIEQNIIPQTESITYNGLLYEYYFDTKTRKSRPKKEKKEEKEEKKYNDDDDDNSKLFYPSYCYAKVKKLDFMEEKENKNNNERYEYYMTVGLNSNIKKDEFKRKDQNLVIILDISGSMGYPFGYYYGQYGANNSNKTKMQIANEAVVTLIKKLKPMDRFGLIIFDDNAQVLHKLELIKDTNLDKLFQTVLSIQVNGGTNFETGYNAAINLYSQLNKDAFNDSAYFNRIIFLTDAQPNIGMRNPNSLLNLVANYGNNKNNKLGNYVYTSFIGIGLDFNSNLIEIISNTRGCNYYSVKSSEEFIIRMDEEFEFMVTPLVFNVSLKLKCEGNSCEIEKVYGTKDEKANKILQTGEITKINTLFPSKKSAKKGGTKGGIQLIRLRKKGSDNINVEIEVTFEDVHGKTYKNAQFVTFEPPKLYSINDMIDTDDDDDDDDNENESFYDNLGIRKGILLCKYVELIKSWIQSLNKNKYKKVLFPKFLKHFKKEMKKCNDNELEKELKIIQKIIDGNYNDDDESDSD